MRKWVDIYLSDIAKQNNKVKLIIADVGDFPEFSMHHPDKFINAGVSESNAIGLAAGLASEGYKVFVYGLSSFFLYRSYEQLKYSVAYWKKNITFIGVGFGWKYYSIGIGHFCPDDILLIQSLPFFEIHTPFQLSQLKTILSNESNNPRYLRLTANIVEEGGYNRDTFQHQYAIVTYGEMVKTCLAVMEKFRSNNPDICLIALTNLDEKNVRDVLSLYKCTYYIVIEDQCKRGGLLPILKEIKLYIVLYMGLPLLPNIVANSREELTKLYCLDCETIYKKIIEILSLYE